MTSFTPDQWAIIGLVLVLGWLLGLMSRSGAGRWKRAYEEERVGRRNLEIEYEARIAAANQRIAELERHAPPITAATAGAIGAAARGQRDDLTKIRGIDDEMERRLSDASVYGYRDLVRLKSNDRAALEGRLGLEPGRIEREHWVEQAEMLTKGRIQEHYAAFG